MSAPSDRSRFRGCLLGGAIGDALGAALEFMSGRAIRERYGERIATFAPAYGRPGAITDDTQMTLFTAEGLIRAHVRGVLKGITSVPSVVHHAYMRWLATQGERIELIPDGLESGWLIGERWLHDRRAPGTTCLSALRASKTLGAFAVNDSKGCGGVMRVAPLGLVAPDAESAFATAEECAALTHGHPSGSLAAGHLAATITGVRDGLGLTDAVDVASALLRTHEHHEEVSSAVDRAVVLARRGASSDSVAELGEGWVAEEALAISLYCALVADDFLHGTSLAVVHDGDSDSTGAITGNLLGTMWGEEVLPADLRRDVEGSAAIARIADDLYEAMYAGTRDANDTWDDYPGF